MKIPELFFQIHHPDGGVFYEIKLLLLSTVLSHQGSGQILECRHRVILVANQQNRFGSADVARDLAHAAVLQLLGPVQSVSQILDASVGGQVGQVLILILSVGIDVGDDIMKSRSVCPGRIHVYREGLSLLGK